MANVDLELNLETEVIEEILTRFVKDTMDDASYEVFEREAIAGHGAIHAAGHALLNCALINAIELGIYADNLAIEQEMALEDLANATDPTTVLVNKYAAAVRDDCSYTFEEWLTYEHNPQLIDTEEGMEHPFGYEADGEALDDAPIVKNNITIHLNGEERDYYPVGYKIDYDEIADETGIEDPIVGWKYSDDSILQEWQGTQSLILTDGMIIVADAPHGMVEIILNGEKCKYPAKQSLTYDKIAEDTNCFHPSVTVSSTRHRDRTMRPGQVVDVEEGMIINAYDTNNA